MQDLKTEIINTALIKYRLKSREIMNTYLTNIFIKKHIDFELQNQILDEIDFYIKTIKQQKAIEIDKSFEIDENIIHFA
jgi:hypothetical protein